MLRPAGSPWDTFRTAPFRTGSVRLLRALALLAVSGPAFAGVRTVAPTGADHAQIASAVAAAAPGDVILVRTGNYGSFSIDGLGLTLVADTNATPLVQGPVLIRNVPAGSNVTIAGLRFGAASTSALTILDCAGSVRVVDVLAWVSPAPFQAEVAAVRVERSSDVAFARATFTGAPGPAPATRAGAALLVFDSAIALHDSNLRGGYGIPGTTSGSAGGHGGAALDLRSGSAFVSGTFLSGGSGGAGGLTSTGLLGCSASIARPGGDGGVGLDAALGSTARVLDSSLVGGPPGAGATTSCGQHASDGTVGAASRGVVSPIAGTARTFTGTIAAREGQSAAFAFRGVPGERVVLFLADGGSQTWNPVLAGTVLVGIPFWRRIAAGTIGANGEGSSLLTVPELGPSQTARVLHLQALFVAPSGASRLSGARPLVLLDAAY